ncbi:AAA family ATPase [Plantactinospora sp. B5E13]|uniref:helix-turn-helix transcriptional regulator n=1 Tax=Plantactinospora sp. B5E13 TaxID=3153758 RepID=UPI00325E1A04
MLGRQAECAALHRLLEAVRAGEGRALVVRGEAGVGKSVLLEYLLDRAADCRVVSVAGAQSEMELSFAAVHQLCAPMLDLLASLPEPQRDALCTAFGLRAGPSPDRVLVGLAVLGLLAAAAKDRPLVCVIDDAQWLDRVSAQVLAFVARRMFAESVVCVFAVREPSDAGELSGLPLMNLVGLSDKDAWALLRRAIPGPLDEQVGGRIIREARGNPLMLLELSRELTHTELAGGFGSPTAQTLPGRVEDRFRRRLERMPAQARRLLLLAAAEPLGDPALLWRAAARLADGIGPTTGAVAAVDDIVDFDGRVRFRHPLVRSAVYRAASPEERRGVHRALAEATDVEADPDRRAWHHAHATAEPDEGVAAELECSSVRAQARGGLAAAAAFLERAAALTPDSRRRAERALAAARTKLLAGAPEPALALLASAQAGPVDELHLARVDLLRAEIAFGTDPVNLAPPMLLKAARQLEPLDPGLARETYLQALSAAMVTVRSGEGRRLVEVAAATRAAPPAPVASHVVDLLLDALALHLTEDARTAAPAMRRALAVFSSDAVSAADKLRWLWAASYLAIALWDERSCRELADHHVRLVREVGALAVLPLALSTRINVHMLEGELAEAASLNEEIHTIVAADGVRTSYGLLVHAGCALALAALQGRRAEAEQLANAMMSEATSCGEGTTLAASQWLRAVLYNGLGWYEEARSAAQQASAYHPSPGAAAHWAPVELVEAAVRSGDRELASRALDLLAQTTRASHTAWARSIEARSRALLSEGREADILYREAIDRLQRTRLRVDLARAHLVYGEWLRRERRRLEAREQLRTACELFTAMGMTGFADRAHRELLATSETARRRTVETGDQLTPQEAQIVRLARNGLTNKEIAGRLYVSPRTVEYHLRKVFAKLGIRSRNQLDVVA